MNSIFSMHNVQTMAPLPHADLLECLRPFGESRLLPRAAYVNDDVFRWEQQHLFTDGWLCAGRGDALRAAGSQAALQVAGRGVLLTRDATGRLFAFENICRHRGHELLACGATASRDNVVCPYHGWCYQLDGTLRHARAIHDMPNARPAELGLIPMGVSEWGGWIFVNLSGASAPFAQHLGDLGERFAAWGCDQLLPAATHVYELQANWKIAIENYHECYHCPMIHPALCRVSAPESGGRHDDVRGAYTAGWMTLTAPARTMSLDGVSHGEMLPDLTDVQRREVHYVSLFPNLLLSLHPDYVMTHRLEPLSPTRTRVECQWLFSQASLAREGFDPAYAVDFWDRTNREDWGAVESVQRGLRSERFIPGILSNEEGSAYRFVHRVASAYLGRG